MSAVTSLSDGTSNAATDDLLGKVRVCGGVRIHCQTRFGQSCIIDTRERDGYRVRMPRRVSPPEAILINTGGGIAGGDRILHDVQVDERAALTVTTQASERIYRSVGNAISEVEVQLSVSENAALNWLPQDTIIFDHARLKRQIKADITSTSKLLIAEALVFGRSAMGEKLSRGLFQDTWRIHRDGKIIFAENVLLQDDTFKILSAPAIAGDAKTSLTMLYIAPDAERRLARVRNALLTAPFNCAASAWHDLLAIRALAHGPEAIRNLMAELTPILSDHPLPRVWLT